MLSLQNTKPNLTISLIGGFCEGNAACSVLSLRVKARLSSLPYSAPGHILTLAMHVKSLYGDIPPVPEVNLSNVLLRRETQKTWSDYTLQIDAATGERRSFREFLSRVEDAATALGASVDEGGLGLRGENGELVAIMSENTLDCATIVQACLMITVPFVFIAAYSTPYELAYSLRLTKPTRLFVQPKLISSVTKVVEEIGLSKDRIYPFEEQGTIDGGFSDRIERITKNRIKRLSPRPANKDTLAYLVFSGGTSGLPKAVMISHGNLVGTILQAQVVAAEAAKVDPPSAHQKLKLPVILAFLPVHHSFGLQTFCIRAFLMRATFVTLRKWDVEIALRSIPKFRITYLPLVPTVIRQLVNDRRLDGTDLSSVDVVSSGAAYLPPKLFEKFSNYFRNKVRLREGYGMSECTLIACASPTPGVLGGRGKVVVGSPGFLAPGMEARIVREDGSEAATNEPGVLFLKGPNVALGYWDNEAGTKDTFVNGWLNTGDRMRINEEGYFFFEERVKDTLKISGNQVSPTEIEKVLLDHPEKLISDVSVAGVSGGRTSDEKLPRAWIVLSSAGKATGEQEVIKRLNAWCMKALSKYKWPRGGFEVTDEIPKAPTGKVLRRVLQEKYEKEMATKAKL